MALEDRSLRMGCRHGWFLVRAVFLVCSQTPSHFTGSFLSACTWRKRARKRKEEEVGGGGVGGLSHVSFYKNIRGLPWWRSGWESACQCRGHGFEPRSGKIPHAAEQLSPCATTTEPARLEPVLRNKRGRDSERPAHRDEGWSPLATTRESPRTETKTQHSHK